MHLISAAPSFASIIAPASDAVVPIPLPVGFATEVAHFERLTDIGRAVFDAPPQAGAALGLLLALAREAVPFDDLEDLDPHNVDRLADLFDERPALAPYVLATLPAKIVNSPPCKHVDTIIGRAVSASTLRDLERSLHRANVPLPDFAQYGGGWRADFNAWRDEIVDWATYFRWLGSGHDPFSGTHPAERFDNASAHASLAGTPLRTSRTGFELALIYAAELEFDSAEDLLALLAQPIPREGSRMPSHRRRSET